MLSPPHPRGSCHLLSDLAPLRRYYGASQPFGSLEGSSEHLEFLSVEQAMYDYAALIRTIKLNRASPDSPVIAFGGSYGGMLAAWLRFKWPQEL